MKKDELENEIEKLKIERDRYKIFYEAVKDFIELYEEKRAIVKIKDFIKLEKTLWEE